VATGVEATALLLLLIFVLLGRTFSSNKDVFWLDGTVLLRTPCDDNVGVGNDDDDRCIGTDTDLRNMILLRLISPRVPILTGEECN
jgi:hypothetical protein